MFNVLLRQKKERKKETLCKGLAFSRFNYLTERVKSLLETGYPLMIFRLTEKTIKETQL